MLLLPFPSDHPKNPEAEFYLPVQQQKAQLGAEAFPAAVEVILSISIFFF